MSVNEAFYPLENCLNRTVTTRSKHLIKANKYHNAATCYDPIALAITHATKLSQIQLCCYDEQVV